MTTIVRTCEGSTNKTYYGGNMNIRVAAPDIAAQRAWLIFFVSLSLLMASGMSAMAKAPPAGTQVPGYYRMQLGQFEITALYDGAIQLPAGLLKNSTEEEIGKLLAKKFVGNPNMQTAVNTYLINTGEHLVLIDTGAGGLFGPDLGNVITNLKAAGYTTDEVDTVILTHLHGDHIGGLNDASGRPTFANAKVLISVQDNDFWLSEEAAAAAPEEAKQFFKMARDMAAPLKASKQWATFESGAELVPGIKAIVAHGHTPGHTAFEVSSNGQKLLIWGDIVHAHAVQFARPDVSIEFDVDQQQAIATRKALMAQVAAEGALVAGMHLPFPGIGHIRDDGNGSYALVPVEFSPLPKLEQKQ